MLCGYDFASSCLCLLHRGKALQDLALHWYSVGSTSQPHVFVAFVKQQLVCLLPVLKHECEMLAFVVANTFHLT